MLLKHIVFYDILRTIKKIGGKSEKRIVFQTGSFVTFASMGVEFALQTKQSFFIFKKGMVINMRFHIAVCDDEREQIEKISSVVKAWCEKEGHRCELRAFSSSEEFLFEYESDSAYDILLLDVEMGDISGISLAKRIRKESARAEIIFITSHFEFIGEGYEVDALHYLLKPISEEKLFEVLSKAAEKLSVAPPSIVIACDGETVKLYESEILYAESFLHYIVIHTKDREYKIKESISLFEEKLSEDFFRAHRSYLISLKHIVRISRTCVLLDDKTELPLARGKYNEINRAYIARN